MPGHDQSHTTTCAQDESCEPEHYTHTTTTCASGNLGMSQDVATGNSIGRQLPTGSGVEPRNNGVGVQLVAEESEIGAIGTTKESVQARPIR